MTSPLTDPQYAFLQALLALNASAAERQARAHAAATSAVRAIEELIAPALEELGAQWDAGGAALSQVYMGGRICERIVDALLPDAGGGAAGVGPRVAIGVIADRHMLGKRIVRSALRAAGWSVEDYGHGSAASLAERACADGVDILLLSALMLPSALEVRALTSALAATSPRTRVVVGGAPFRFDPRLWREVGAHACGRGAGEAVAIVRRLAEELAPCAA